jgi:hypothetical protein
VVMMSGIMKVCVRACSGQAIVISLAGECPFECIYTGRGK